MKHPLQVSLVAAGACLWGAAGCKPAAKPAADDDRAAATTSADDKSRAMDGADSKPAAARAVKPVTATRDERAVASLSTVPGDAPKLGIGNLKRKDPDAETASTGATVVEASKASSPLLQTANAARAASATGGMSSQKAPVRENMNDDADADASAEAN